jgi:hypothetical protein
MKWILSALAPQHEFIFKITYSRDRAGQLYVEFIIGTLYFGAGASSEGA